MRKKNKIKYTFSPKKTKSHKKRNAAILGGALALIFAGASVKNQDEK